MTRVVFSQRALVEASLQMASTAERHGTYGNRLVPGSNARTATKTGANPSPARPSTEAGRDRRSGGSTHCTGCGRRWGTLTSDWVLGAGYEHESSWEDGVCASCVWDRECELPVPRRIPGARRAA